MAAARFTVGDRVKARTSLFVPAGTPGTVHEILLHVPGVYYVQFDGYAHPAVMRASDLERLAAVP